MESGEKQLDARQGQLVAVAAESAKNAFCVYSKQRVGVSVLGTDGEIYRGCTFDSAAYPCSICAAHIAVAQAATKGKALVYLEVAECSVVEIVLEGEEKEDTRFPLKGCCLEWLFQYAHSEEVYIHSAVMIEAKDETQNETLRRIKTYKLSDLLPLGRQLPLCFPSRVPALSVIRVEAAEGQEADEGTTELLKAAVKAAEGSCCWNSGVSVGCAILTEDGIVTGANVETSALGIGSCFASPPAPNTETFA